MGHDPLLLSFIVVIIGGLGSLRGTLLAAFVIGISDGVISVFFSPTLAKILAGHPDYEVTGGQILLDGEDIAARRVAQLAATVGLAFQWPDRQIFSSTVRDEVERFPYRPTRIAASVAELER